MKSDTEKLLRTREMHKLIKMTAAVGAAGIMGSAGWVAAAELSPSTDRAGNRFPDTGMAIADPRVALPENWSDWVLYRTSDRGSVIEDMYAPKEVMTAMKKAESFPYGTRLLLVEYHSRSGERAGVRRYIVMQKEKGWGAIYPESLRNGEWEYQAYHGDRRAFTESEDPVSRCLSCHLSAAASDYVYSAEDLKAAARRN